MKFVTLFWSININARPIPRTEIENELALVPVKNSSASLTTSEAEMYPFLWPFLIQNINKKKKKSLKKRRKKNKVAAFTYWRDHGIEIETYDKNVQTLSPS